MLQNQRSLPELDLPISPLLSCCWEPALSLLRRKPARKVGIPTTPPPQTTLFPGQGAPGHFRNKLVTEMWRSALTTATFSERDSAPRDAGNWFFLPYPQQGRTKSKNCCAQISNGNREKGTGDDEAAKSTQTLGFDACL